MINGKAKGTPDECGIRLELLRLKAFGMPLENSFSL
ncbi:MAG: hypothetical protein JWN60_1786 [Acidobacteria bacterium]|jgi:hypothetical protein|nr:hypothetical protein [Acidobacteriota bacterium]